jgi:Ca2+-dependent lipid-binding protein
MSVPFAVEDLEVEGTLRLEFRPLLSTAPYFGELALSLVHMPRVDFSISAGNVNVMLIPGVDKAIVALLKVC